MEDSASYMIQLVPWFCQHQRKMSWSESSWDYWNPGVSAADMSLSFSQNEQAFEEVFQNANFNTYEFRIRVKLETYNVSIPKNPNNVAFVV